MKRRYLSILLVMTMIFFVTGGFAVPAKGALLPYTATLTITPSQSEIDVTTGSVDVIYTLKVTPPAGQHIGVFSFDLKAPEGMTLSKTFTDTRDGDGYWLNSSLSYHPTFNKTGIFETFSYTPEPKGYFIGSGTTPQRNMTTEADIMTIKATITDASKAGSYALTAANPNVGPDGTDTFTFDIISNPVIVKASAVTPVANEPVTATAVTVGQTLASSILSGSFKVSSTDSTAVTGTLAWTDSATTVNATGDFEWTFTPTDTTLYNVVTGTVNVVANPAALVINGGTLNPATKGAPYEYQLGTATKGGVPPYTWSVNSGTLPLGITLNSATGYLAGIPTATGTYNFNVMVTDSHPNSASADYTLLVNPDTTPPQFGAIPLAEGDTFHPGSKHVEFIVTPAENGVTAYYVAVDPNLGDKAPTSSQVVAGVDYGDVDVYLSGSQGSVNTNGYRIAIGELPADNTAYDIYVVLVDASDNASDPASITLTTPIKLLTDSYPKVGADQAYGSKQIEILNKANGTATAYYLAVPDGAAVPLPGEIMQGSAGLYADEILAEGSVELDGINEESTIITLAADATAYDIYVMLLVENYNGNGFIMNIYSDIIQLDVTTPPAALALSDFSLQTGKVGEAYSGHDFKTNTTGGVAPYTYSYTGNLPAGLTLSTDGVLSGTPTQYASVGLTVTVTDFKGVTAQKTYWFNILPADLFINEGRLNQGKVGHNYQFSFATVTGGGTDSRTWSLNSGTIPPGLSLNQGTGYLTGIPTTAGDYTFDIKVQDSWIPTPHEAVGAFSIHINEPDAISLEAISGVTAPARGAAPVTTITQTDQFTGTVTWSPAIAAGGKFAASTVYTATITLTPKPGYTLSGVGENFFTVAGADPVSNPADTGIVTAVFPKTAAAPTGGGGGGGGAVTPTVAGVEIKSAPDKLVYTEGDELDLTGLEVTLTYSNGNKKYAALNEFDENDITVSPKDGDVLDAADTEIVITVNGITAKQAITVNKKETVTPPPVEEPALTDIDNHWAQANIEYLVGIGAIAGYPDETFRPDSLITRAEFAKIIVDAFELTAGSGKIFTDTADHWAKDYIAIAAANGIVLGYNDQEFGSEDLITREQMAIIIVKAAGLTAKAGELDFIDKADISSWAYDWVVSAAENELMGGYEDKSFKPLNNATRAEAATAIYNVLMKQ